MNTNGGFFEAITNGSCVDPLVFSIVDATGRQTTAELHNVEGTEDRPVITAPDLAVSPTTHTSTACTGKTFSFVIFGGLAPYNVRPSAGIASPQVVPTAGGTTTISGLLTGGGGASIVILDSSTPAKSVTATIACSAASAPALSAQPSSVTVAAPSPGPPATTGCTGMPPFLFVVLGGTPPYTVTPTRGTANPTIVTSSGGTTQISGLSAGSGTTSIVFLDSSVPQQSFAATISCS